MNIEVKTITKYVVDGEEFNTEQEAKEFCSMKDMDSRIYDAYFREESSLSAGLCDEITRELPDVIKLFKLAGYEIKDVRGEEG